MVAKAHVTFEVADTAIELSGLCLSNQFGVLLRIDHKETVCDMPILAWLKKKLFGPTGSIISTLPFLCVRESKLDSATGTETNPHYHALFFVASDRFNALRQTIKRGWAGNEEYSLKKAKPELLPEQFNYICKGKGPGTDDKPDVVYGSEHFTTEFLTECRRLYWKNHAAIQTVSKKRKREISIHENVLNLCRARGYTDQDRGKIFDVIIEYYRKRIKYLNPSYVRNLVFQTAVYLSPDGPAQLNLKDYCTGYPFTP